MCLFIYPFVHSKKKNLLSLYNEEGTLADLGKDASAIQHKNGQELV